MEGAGQTASPPVRVAAIDIGSNAIRFTAVEWRGRRVELDYRRAAVRLGHNAFLAGRLEGDKLDAAVVAMVEFGRRMSGLGVARYRAVATSAVRDAENGRELVSRAASEAGVDIEVIDGAEEARLVWTAVRDRLAVRGRWLLVDLGGGSLEVSTVADEALERSETYPLGTVRLLERLGDEPTGDEVDDVVAEVAPELAIPPAGTLRGVMATGGNIEALAELAGAPVDGAGAATLSLDALSGMMAELEAMSCAARIEEMGLRPDRADVIVPAGRVYRRVAELAGATEIVVPNVGVTDGLLLGLATP